MRFVNCVMHGQKAFSPTSKQTVLDQSPNTITATILWWFAFIHTTTTTIMRSIFFFATRWFYKTIALSKESKLFSKGCSIECGLLYAELHRIRGGIILLWRQFFTFRGSWLIMFRAMSHRRTIVESVDDSFNLSHRRLFDNQRNIAAASIRKTMLMTLVWLITKLSPRSIMKVLIQLLHWNINRHGRTSVIPLSAKFLFWTKDQL